MKESEPMVELIGDTFDLDSLEWWSAQSPSQLYTVVKGGDKYWLKTPRFGLHTDSQILREQAKELIPIIKGASFVRGVRCDSIGVGNDIKTSKQTDVIVEPPPVTDKIMFWKENGIFFTKFDGKTYEIGPELSANYALIEHTILELDARMKKGLELDTSLHALENCIDDEYIYRTFSHFVDVLSWLSLWNTYEMIKFDVDKNLEQTFTPEKCVIVGNGWAKPLELKSFTNTANSHLAEANPRHSLAYSLNEEEKAKSPNPVKQQKHEERKTQYERDHPPMSLADASSLITRIFRGWCKWKAPNC